MIKEIYVIKNSKGSYYARGGGGWRPGFTSNLQEARQFDDYYSALKLLREGTTSYTKMDMWFYKGFYQIEKWFVAEAPENDEK
jgi:hypothetical protein